MAPGCKVPGRGSDRRDKILQILRMVQGKRAGGVAHYLLRGHTAVELPHRVADVRKLVRTIGFQPQLEHDSRNAAGDFLDKAQAFLQGQCCFALHRDVLHHAEIKHPGAILRPATHARTQPVNPAIRVMPSVFHGGAVNLVTGVFEAFSIFSVNAAAPGHRINHTARRKSRQTVQTIGPTQAARLDARRPVPHRGEALHGLEQADLPVQPGASGLVELFTGQQSCLVGPVGGHVLQVTQKVGRAAYLDTGHAELHDDFGPIRADKRQIQIAQAPGFVKGGQRCLTMRGVGPETKLDGRSPQNILQRQARKASPLFVGVDIHAVAFAAQRNRHRALTEHHGQLLLRTHAQFFGIQRAGTVPKLDNDPARRHLEREKIECFARQVTFTGETLRTQHTAPGGDLPQAGRYVSDVQSGQQAQKRLPQERRTDLAQELVCHRISADKYQIVTVAQFKLQLAKEGSRRIRDRLQTALRFPQFTLQALHLVNNTLRDRTHIGRFTHVAPCNGLIVQQAV